jgi:hypothetical protein
VVDALVAAGRAFEEGAVRPPIHVTRSPASRKESTNLLFTRTSSHG